MREKIYYANTVTERSRIMICCLLVWCDVNICLGSSLEISCWFPSALSLLAFFEHYVFVRSKHVPNMWYLLLSKAQWFSKKKKKDDTSSSKNPAKCKNTFVRAVLNMFLKCLPTRIRAVGSATYSLCTCRYFASRILLGSTRAGICQHEIFSLLMLCCQLLVTLAASWKTIS